MYQLGKGVNQDVVTAHMWYDIAAVRGNKLASENKDSITKQMTRPQREEAEKRAKVCIKSKFRQCD